MNKEEGITKALEMFLVEAEEHTKNLKRFIDRIDVILEKLNHE